MRLKAGSLAYLPSLVLIVVALHQIHLARHYELTPWKGGGFGMFSSTQLGFIRYVRIFVSAPDRSEELNIPDSLFDLADRAAILPTDRRLKKLAEAIVVQERRNNGSIAEVRIEVWRSHFQKDTMAAVTEKFRDYVYKVD
jgi:hypothetical protein